MKEKFTKGLSILKVKCNEWYAYVVNNSKWFLANLKNMSKEKRSEYSLYFAVFIVVLLVLIFFPEKFLYLAFIAFLIHWMVKNQERKDIEEREKRKKEEQLMKKKQQDNDNKLIELKTKLNAPITMVINYSFEKYVLFSEESSLIMINEHIYSFTDILNFSLSDNSIEVFSSTLSTTKTKTGSMVGRAIVGGILTGGIGAIIGGVTASKKTETSGGTSHTKHNYTLIVTINNIANPIERIYLEDNERYVNELCSLFSIVLNRKQTL